MPVRPFACTPTVQITVRDAIFARLCYDAIGINPPNFSIDPPFNTELCGGPGR